jgi:hypothetical protein
VSSGRPGVANDDDGLCDIHAVYVLQQSSYSLLPIQAQCYSLRETLVPYRFTLSFRKRAPCQDGWGVAV